MTTELTTEPALTISDMAKAARNEPSGTFTLTNPHTGTSRTFEIKDLDYDSYIEFVSLARPIVTAIAGAIQMSADTGLSFSADGIDYEAILKLAGSELPRMAWLCCKQSAPAITLQEVKILARRPHVMLDVVLKQVKQNELVKEFADFFPHIAADLTSLLPDATAAMTPTTAPTE